MFNSKKKFALALLTPAVLSLTVFITVSRASEVTLTADITIPMTIGSEIINFTLSGSALNSFNVEQSSILIDVPTGSGNAYLKGPTSISFGASTDCSIAPGKSTYVINEGQRVTITPTKPASTAAEYVNTCDGRQGGGGGGGGGGGNGGSVTTPSSPSTLPKEDAQKPADVKKPTVDGLKIIKVFTNKTTKVKTEEAVSDSSASTIKKVVDLMISNGLYTISSSIFGSGKFVVNSYVTKIFARNVAITISRVCASSCTGDTSSREDKIKKVTVGDEGKVTRLEFYEMLLRARGVKSDGTTVKIKGKDTSVETLCKGDNFSQLSDKETIAAAFKSGIATRAKVNNVYTCSLDKAITREAALQFANKVL